MAAEAKGDVVPLADKKEAEVDVDTAAAIPLQETGAEKEAPAAPAEGAGDGGDGGSKANLIDNDTLRDINKQMQAQRRASRRASMIKVDELPKKTLFCLKKDNPLRKICLKLCYQVRLSRKSTKKRRRRP